MPDDFVFIDEIHKTTTGKFSEKDLREQFADYKLPQRGPEGGSLAVVYRPAPASLSLQSSALRVGCGVRIG